MTEQDIEKLLSGKQLDLKTLEKRLEAVTNSDKEELSKILNHMLMKGVIGAHDKAFYLLKDQRMTLAKVTVKKRNFVIAKTIPDMTEVRLSGDEADGLLIRRYSLPHSYSGNHACCRLSLPCQHV
ncbi:MAG: hypothetical protein LKE52_01970 [Bacilli bacterium]|nr:hypothetical protein [Bacilli bacterium]